LKSSNTWKSATLLMACFFALGCNQNADTAITQPESKSLAEEATGLAQKFADLTTVKCKDGYYSDPAGRPRATLKVRATGDELTDQKHFLGYQWYGMAIVGDTDGSGAAYQIYKRGGEWYYSPSSGGKGEPDVRVDLLQSIKFACPAAG
jgi:hypothetical protein